MTASERRLRTFSTLRMPWARVSLRTRWTISIPRLANSCRDARLRQRSESMNDAPDSSASTLDADALDRADMERLAAGRDPALNDLMERHASKLFNYLLRCLQNEEDAADAAQEAFVRVYQN